MLYTISVFVNQQKMHSNKNDIAILYDRFEFHNLYRLKNNIVRDILLCFQGTLLPAKITLVKQVSLSWLLLYLQQRCS